MLGAPVDLGLDARGAQDSLQLRAQRLDITLTVGAALVERGGDAAVLLRLEVAERPTMPAVCSGVRAARASSGRASSACASSVLSVRPPMISAASTAHARSAGARALARSSAARARLMASRT